MGTGSGGMLMAQAADIMTREVVTVSPETPVREVGELLSSQRFGSVPVVDANNVLQGLVTEEDLVSRAASFHLPRHITFLGGIVFLENPQRFQEEAERILAVTAREIMDEEVPTTSPETPVTEIATRMLENDLRRLVVLDDARHLLGIITRADIVRMMTSSGQLPDDNKGNT